MNDLVDKLADFAFHRAIRLQNFIDSDFPFEKLRLKHKGKKITGNLCREIDNLTGERTAKKYFAKTGRISRENFHAVWWDGMEHLMKSYPKMYRVWLTKHVSGCCGTNKQMSYWKPGWSAMCPSCGSVVERTSHVTRCREQGRKKMLHSSVGELVDWM
jgi:predicted RNA-binding Zn-ribbon protein involved in translation (DUF1610 family)